MDAWISCNACGADFLLETHIGLLRCEACNERMAFRFPHIPARVVQA
ncbi:MAG: hypothetical protein ACYDBQ_05605 [Thermoplasmatota archaeon]